MLPRRKFQSENLFSTGIPTNTSPALAVGKMIFIGGQVDLNMEAVVTRPGDLSEQVRIVLANVEPGKMEGGSSYPCELLS